MARPRKLQPEATAPAESAPEVQPEATAPALHTPASLGYEPGDVIPIHHLNLIGTPI